MVFQIHLKKTGYSEKMGRSTLVADNIKILTILISILSLITSAKESSLFRVELIFTGAKISLLRLFLRIRTRFCFFRVSIKQSLTVTKS